MINIGKADLQSIKSTHKSYKHSYPNISNMHALFGKTTGCNGSFRNKNANPARMRRTGRCL